MRYIGVDPGANLGIVCVDVHEQARLIGSRLEIRWAGSFRLHPSNSQKRTHAENDAHLFDRVQGQLVSWRVGFDRASTPRPMVAVLEEPYTQTASWKGAKGEGRQTGTLFSLGKYYGLALAACSTLCGRVYSHPPTNDRRGQRTGWMQGSGRIQKRELTLLALRGLARQCGCMDPDALSEDEVMAFGVLKFHLDRVGIDAD
jgi:hypothetical protein